MGKIRHKFFCSTYSDHDLDCLFSPYERKYNLVCVVNLYGVDVLIKVHYSSIGDTFKEMRKLVGIKHGAIKSFKNLKQEKGIIVWK